MSDFSKIDVLNFLINIGTIDSGDLPDPKHFVWRCPACERIYVFDGNRLVKYYVPHDMDELADQ